MSKESNSFRCDGCGLVNWASAVECKRCGAALGAQNQWASGDSWQPPSYSRHNTRPAVGKSSGSFGKLIVGLIVLMALAGTFYGGLPDYLRGPRWRDFTLQPGNFYVRMPASPDVNTLPLVAEGKIPWMGATAKLWGKEYCSVKFADFPLLQLASVDQFDQAAAEMARSSNSTLIAKRPVAFDGGRGMEVEMRPPDNLMTNGRAYARIYLVGSRMYVLMLVGQENGRLVRERGQFFDSFRLLQKGG